MRILNFCGRVQCEHPDHRRGGGTYVEPCGVAVQHTREIQLLHLLLQSAGEPGVHTRAAGEDDVLVQLRPYIDGGRLDCLEEHF